MKGQNGLQAGDRVRINPDYWPEPKAARSAIVVDPQFACEGQIALVHPLSETGRKLHFRCTVPIRFLHLEGP